MPAKKGGIKNKKKQSTPEPTEWDDLDIESLEKTIVGLEEKLKSVQKDRNYWLNDVQKINDIDDTTVQKIKDIDDKLYSMDQEIENVEEEHRVDLEVYSHKVRHLNYGHERKKEEIMDERDDILKQSNNDYNDRINHLKISKINLKEEIKVNDVINAAEIKELKQQHRNEIEAKKVKMKDDMIELQIKFEVEILELEKEMELNRKISIHDVEERNDLHMHELQQNQVRSKERLKSYYDNITSENQKTVKDLEEEISDKSERMNEMKQNIDKIIVENKSLQEPLAATLAQVASLKKDVEKKEKHELTLFNVKNRMKLTDCRMTSLNEKIDQLQKDYNILEKKRDDLYQNFKRNVTLACERNNCRSIVVGHNLKKENEAMESMRGQLCEVVTITETEESKVQDISYEMTNLMQEKEDVIEKLQQRILNARKAFANDILQKKITIIKKVK